MRAQEFITEGMTFSVSVKKPYVTPSGVQTFIWTDEDWRRQQKMPCWLCGGTGKDKYDASLTCEVCKSTGFYTDDVSDAPELNVSNANGYEIQRMLGLEPNYSGIIYNQDLPELIRKLIKLKNQKFDRYTQQPKSSYGQMKRVVDPDTGITKLVRTATVIDMGRTSEQVERYIDKLLEIAKFAQQHNASIGWA